MFPHSGVAIALLTFLQLSQAYPNGPPLSTCLTLFPKHGSDKQSGPSPYRLVLSSGTYSPGQNIEVRIESTNAQKMFKGFQVVVHRVANSGNAEDFIGSFTVSNATTSIAVDCHGQPKTMMVHTSGEAKSVVTGSWAAPASNQGDLQFFLTVVESEHVFWSKISYRLQAQPATPVVAPQRTVPKISPTSASPDWMECGKRKGCWMVPVSGSNSCNGQDCQAAVSFRQQKDVIGGNMYHFELAVKGADKYIALGFSEDLHMGDDQTVACTATTGYESVQLGYNPSSYNDRAFTIGVTNLTVGQADGQAYCSFTRKAQLTSTFNGTARPFNIDNPYYLLLAWGRIPRDTDVLEHHDHTAISSAKVNVSSLTTIGFSSSSATKLGLTLTSCALLLFCLTFSILLDRK